MSVEISPMILSVFVPLFGAIAAFVLPRAAALIGFATLVLTSGAVAWLARDVLAAGAVGLPLGGWGAPLGIDLRADGLSVAMLALTSVVGFLVSIAALDSLKGPEQARQRQYFWPLWLLLLTGMNGVYLSTDIFNLYVMIEVIALAAVGLTVLSGSRAALQAGLDYMYASIFGALLFLMGVGFVYLQLGRLDFAGLTGAAPTGALIAALALIFVGLALKTALFPLHFWLPAAHANATAPASALLSGLVVKAALYVVLRLAQYMPFPSENLLTLVGLMGAGAVIWGGVQALRAERLKLLVAWSTVAQIGLIFVAFARAGEVGLSESWKAAALLILAHGIAKAAMFLAAGRIKDEIGHDVIRDLDRTPIRPTLAQFTFALAAISLIGLPPSLGFIGKWSLMEGAMAAGYWHWVGVTMAGTLLSVAYFSRVFAGFLRFDRVRAPVGEHQGWALADAAPLTLALMAIGLGLLAAPVLSFIEIGYPFGVAP
ncbi:complex I subunit 5 family protein [Roseinatronobacter bogoriensis]|uniref:Oxidoreductase n=1 Tax=Roseinatronobacter bogoriensis subsp. barguzinensis TaxID=441209 RepID=A0A2K8KEJ9_9RHOB|nr:MULTISPECIES: proton-conducting transporter membrane subunit [Rhodobaca]ATX67426.1 oxidoreductase [Rhodobaca barguzinensis]MBB4207010.1 formate hydrogenlyase subunit 3/multisubunit Na+/H+ antiporter MnhD subunit [Rhodobaca bogoriensis DSM 18756]TDW36058.1 formate hydrogenlyase subunit 3/multisubunit Na+/H+ antiporter MnhD subunit [Rhodobaca barguzinensis]TDY74071.1 multisubunit sodium/proton antiporter MrpD subunit [Rhodobaca bogoriensis DSM 18756]